MTKPHNDYASRTMAESSRSAQSRLPPPRYAPALLSDCLARQDDEILALASILPPGSFVNMDEALERLEIAAEERQGRPRLILDVPVELSGAKDVLASLRRPTQPQPPRAASGELKSSSSPPRNRPTPADHPAPVRLSLSHLPPIRLVVDLPEAYPAARPPNVRVVRSSWLGTKGRTWLRKRLLQSWAHDVGLEVRDEEPIRIESDTPGGVVEEAQGMECLYAWYELLTRGIWEELSDAVADLDASAADLDGAQDPQSILEKRKRYPLLFIERNGQAALHVSLQAMANQAAVDGSSGSKAHDEMEHVGRLIAYDREQQQAAFEGERFDCAICLEGKRGKECFRLSGCSHIFCIPCLQSYLGALVTEGSVRQASCCPDPSCVKARVKAENEEAASVIRGDKVKEAPATAAAAAADAQASPSGMGSISDAELLSLLGSEAFARLQWLREKNLAEADPTAAYCPRLGCQTVARGDKGDAGTAYANMRRCPRCDFCWCLLCKKTWHGKSPCSFHDRFTLIEEYNSYPEGSSERLAMERRYGQAQLLRLQKACDEELQERATLDWITSKTTPCPTCRAAVLKSYGCNHMKCGHCATHFCYRPGCGRRLDPLEPYKHFNTPGTPCFGKLFEAVEGDGGGPPPDAFGEALEWQEW